MRRIALQAQEWAGTVKICNDKNERKGAQPSTLEIQQWFLRSKKTDYQSNQLVSLRDQSQVSCRYQRKMPCRDCRGAKSQNWYWRSAQSH